MLYAKLLVVLCLATIWVRPLWADTVELKNGQRVEGVFSQAGPKTVSIIVADQTISFDTALVRAIYFGADADESRGHRVGVTRNLAESRLVDEAIRALQGVRSVVNGNPTYRDFSPRVIEARIVVDRYLQSVKMAGPVRGYISDSMDIYAYGSLAWGAKGGQTKQDFDILASLGGDETLAKCPDVLAACETLSKGANKNTWKFGVAVTFQLPSLFRCASVQLDQAISEWNKTGE